MEFLSILLNISIPGNEEEIAHTMVDAAQSTPQENTFLGCQ
jgi:hypothetical protein